MSRTTGRRLLIAGVAVLAVGFSSACGVGLSDLSAPPPPQPTATTQSYDPMDSSSPSEEPTEEPSAAPEDTEYRFGETIVYEDGLEVTLSKLKTFKPSEYSVYDEGADKYVEMTVTIKNGTGALYDPSSFYSTATTGDDEAEQVFDSENGHDGSPSTKLRAGKSVKFKIGYGVNEKSDFVVEVSPGYTADDETYNSVLFVGAVK